MASEPFYVGAPIHDAVVSDAVFVPDSPLDRVGTWLLEFSNGAEREIRTEVGHVVTAGSLLRKGQYQAIGVIESADRRYNDDSPRLPPPRVQKCRCYNCTRW